MEPITRAMPRKSFCRPAVDMRSRGSVLVLVLWVVSLLTAFTVSLGYGARQKATLANRISVFSQLHSAALSGVEKMRGVLKRENWSEGTDTRMEPWANNEGYFKEIAGGEAVATVYYTAHDAERPKPIMRYGALDEDGKINVNTSDAPTLRRLLQSVTTLDSDAAEELSYAIVDWRDSDSNYGHPNYGAEDTDYGDLKLPYEAKDAPLEVAEELLLVQGMNREIFDRIRNYVTVHGQGVVNANTASLPALLALGLEKRTVEKMAAYRAGADGNNFTGDDLYFLTPDSIKTQLMQAIPPLDKTEEFAVESLVSAGKLGTTSNYFQVTSRAVLTRSGEWLEASAVMDRKGKIYTFYFSQIQNP